MSARRGDGRAALAGLALVAVHVALLPALLRCPGRASLRVVTHPAGADIRATWPRSLDGRVRVRHSGTIRAPTTPGAGAPGPGMHRVEWSVRYRGGFEETVGLTRLVGPFQDPAAPPCALRVLIGQSFLDGGVAAVLAGALERELAGLSRWPLGRFERVDSVRLRWVSMADIDDKGLERAILRAALPGPVPGVLRAVMELRFDSGRVPLWIAVIPQLADGGLRLGAHVEAELALDRRIHQILVDLFDGSERAGAAARREVNAALAGILARPPAVELAGDHALRVDYCPDEAIEIHTGQYAAVPMRLMRAPGGPVAPVLLGKARRAAPARLDAPLAVELELDAVNGILHELWHAGALDRALGPAALERINGDALVQELLSVRLGELRLSLPPTVWPARDARGQGQGLRLGVEASLRIRDQGSDTPARVFGAVGIGFRAGDAPGLIADLALDTLALTCEPEPGVLVPCYASLVAAARDRAGDVHAPLSARATALLEALILGRRVDLEAARFEVTQARVHVEDAGPSAVLRVDLLGRLEPAAGLARP